VVSALRAKAVELQVQSSAPKAILLGRHLVELGIQPGPEMGVILKKAYDAQIEGRFFNLSQAMEWLAGEFSTQSPELEARTRAAVAALERGSVERGA
jgi:tRNA nucleotidyltransferase (CCA-adding enzyme)